MKANVVVKNLREVEAALDRKSLAVDKAAEKIVRKGGALIEMNAKKVFRARPPKSVRTSKTGKTWYYAGKKSPGESYATGYAAPRPPRPTNRSGLLRDSIHTKANRISKGRWTSKTGPSMRYGRSVELGFARRRKFPFMAPGLAKSRDGLIEIYRKEWRDAVTK